MPAAPAKQEILNPVTFQSRAQLEMMVANKMKKSLGFSRDPKPNIPEIAPLYIFSITDRKLVWHQPGFEFFTIEPCPDGADYGPACTIPGIVSYEYLKVDSTTWGLHNGEEIVAEILGIGAAKDPKNDLRRFGFFCSRSNPPQQAELDLARKMLMETCDALIGEGDRIHAEGQKKGQDGQMIGAEHIWAVRLAGQQRDWSRLIRQMIDCPVCLNPIPANASVHYGPGGCGAVIDWDVAIASGLKKESDRPKPVRKHEVE